MNKITTIIPIYNAKEEVSMLLDSLKKYYNFELGKVLLLNDCSNQETTVFLENFVQENKQFNLISNEKNLGFVKTCNKGLRLVNSEIAVLLNSDTLIPLNFCEKIISCFDSDSRIGLASPISSNSNSYYIPMREALTLEQMNIAIEQNHKCIYPRLPEAEGFCFCVRRSVIDNQGYLDEIYDKGYHEEVDYSYRAITNGWEIALIDNLYVYHKRQVSFGAEQRAKLIEKNNEVFYSRWQGFRDKYKKEKGLVNPCIGIEKEVFGS